MSTRQFVLAVDDDHVVTDAVAMLLERSNLTAFLCSDVESAETVLVRHPITHVLTDVQFSGPFSFEGLHFLARVREHRPSCRIVVMTGYGSEDLRGAARAQGAAAVLAKPFGQEELDQALALTPPHGEADDYELVRVAGIEEILSGGGLSAVFQPIVRLHRDLAATTFGYEALTRMGGSWSSGGIEELFAYASRCNRLADLNLAAIECALGEARRLPQDATVFLNVDPLTFDRRDVPSFLRATAARHRVALSRLVLEITERSDFGGTGTAMESIAALRADGVRYALDDLGSAYSHLDAIDWIRPSFIKVGQTFGTAFDEDPTRTRIVRHVLGLSRDFGCSTILEGVEAATTARAAVAFGIELGQGYYFGRPSAAEDWIVAA